MSKREQSAPASRPYADIGERLVQLMAARGLNQDEFGERIGAKQNTISEWLSGKRRIGIDNAMVACREFGVTLDWIYLGDHSGLPLRLEHAIRTGTRLPD